MKKLKSGLAAQGQILLFHQDLTALPNQRKLTVKKTAVCGGLLHTPAFCLIFVIQGYPRAALFGFCVALVAYTIMSVIKAALSNVHGVDVIEQQLSGYYVANEISGICPGMMIAIEYDHWHVFRQMTSFELVRELKKLAAKVKLSKFKKHPRGPKKPQPKRKSQKNKPHVSTAKLLKQRKR